MKMRSERVTRRVRVDRRSRENREVGIEHSTFCPHTTTMHEAIICTVTGEIADADGSARFSAPSW